MWQKFLLLVSFACSSASADIYFSSRTIGPSTNIYSVNYQGELTKITDDDRWRDTDASISDAGEIVFISNRKDEVKIDLNKTSEDFNIFKLSSDEGKIQQLSFDPQLDYSPVFSANNEWIAYIQKAGEYSKLMLLKNSETIPESLTIADNIGNISWSPNGRSLVFVKTDKALSSIQLLDIHSREKQILLQVSRETQINSQTMQTLPKASYNKLIKNNDDLFLKTIASAQWSPDSRKIAYILTSVGRQVRQLRVLDLWRTNEMAISSEKVQVQYPVTWSKDSNRLLYSGLVDYNYRFDESSHKKVYEGSMQIYLAQLNKAKQNAEVQQLTSGSSLYNRPVFSPDESKIAFLYGESLASRTLALQTLTLDGKERRQFYDKVAGDSFLLWR